MFTRVQYGSAVVALLSTALPSFAQDDDSNAIWHNRYHAVLSMSAYGDYAGNCPQIFTEEHMRQNFPNTDLAPWDIIESFGPTPSGAQGYTVQIPEMDKVVLVFRGDYNIESNLDQAVTTWDALGLGGNCPECTVNAQALQAYLEAREATNNWALSRARMDATGLEYSITGHGFGGMLSLIASVDLGWAGACRWSHNYGTPRTFNQAGVDFYTRLFQGVAGERGVANNDPVPEIIPAGPNYAHTGTVFYYHGYNATTHMNMVICRDDFTNPACAPRRPYEEVAHYFYFSNVGQCGQGRWRENRGANQRFIDSELGTRGGNGSLADSAANATSSSNTTVVSPSGNTTEISAPTNGTQAIYSVFSGLRDTLNTFLNGASRQ